MQLERILKQAKQETKYTDVQHTCDANTETKVSAIKITPNVQISKFPILKNTTITTAEAAARFQGKEYAQNTSLKKFTQTTRNNKSKKNEGAATGKKKFNYILKHNIKNNSSSIISILQQQKQPPSLATPSSSQLLLTSSSSTCIMFTSANVKHSTYPAATMWQQRIQILTVFLLSFLMLHVRVDVLPVAAAACRKEESRSCEAICNADGRNCTIRALLLLPDDDMYVASMRRVLPILALAEQKIRERQIIPPYIQFDWMAEDVQCDAAYAVIKAMDGIVKNCAHIVFGPVCDYALAAVSRITKYFNSNGTPLISVGGSTYDFEKKKTTCDDEFYMLLRTGMLSFETISELTIAAMKHNHWSHSILFYERDGQKNVAGLHTCFLMMNSLGKQMRKEGMTFAQYPLNMSATNRTEEMIREIGNKHSSKSHF